MACAWVQMVLLCCCAAQENKLTGRIDIECNPSSEAQQGPSGDLEQWGSPEEYFGGH